MDILFYILSIARIFIEIIGIIGNVLSFIVFSSNTFKGYSINIYCRASAISDSIILTFQLICDIATYFFSRSFQNESNGFCKFYQFITIGLTPVSVWILMAFSIGIYYSYILKLNLIYKKYFD